MKKFFDLFRKNALDQLFKKAQKEKKSRILITWNRGLGDIALGLYALTFRIRQFIPEAHITFVTRSDLEEGFALLPNVNVLVGKDWKRGSPFDLIRTLAQHNLKPDAFDLILENPDATRWLKWQIGSLTPKLEWNAKWDDLWKRFDLQEDKRYVGVHVQTETNYNYEKNWPLSHWKELFEKLRKEHSFHIVLFGFSPSPVFTQEGIIDLRGKTNLPEMLSIIKQRCSLLVVPDSGVLSLTYYLNIEKPLKIISLWADPHQGVLKQNVASPNSKLLHLPLIGPSNDISQISVNTVLEKVHVPH